MTDRESAKSADKKQPSTEKSSEEESPEAAAPPSKLDVVAKSIQIVSVVVGVVISVLSYTSALNKESQARIAEAERYNDSKKIEEEKRKFEAARPFVELRQEIYLDAVKTAAVLANPQDHTPEDYQKAQKRFRELYVAELTLVEGFGVETRMKDLADAMRDPVAEFNPVQEAAFNLAHALRDSLRKSWKFEESVVDNPGD